MNTALHRTGIAVLTNKSGGSVAQGDTVIVDTANASAFTTTTTSGFVDGQIGVVLEPNGIANNASGLVAFGTWIPKINLNTAATIGQFIKHHSVAKQGTPHGAPMVAGDFAIALEANATPKAIMLGSVFQGSGGGRTLIASATPTGTGTVSFTSIPATYTKLVIEFVARGTAAAATVTMTMSLNNDTTDANYRRGRMYYYGATTIGAGTGADGRVVADFINADSAPANQPTYGRIEIPFYAGTTFYKQAIVETISRNDESANHQLYEESIQNWENAGAINRVDFVLSTGNFASNSEFRLYGEL